MDTQCARFLSHILSFFPWRIQPLHILEGDDSGKTCSCPWLDHSCKLAWEVIQSLAAVFCFVFVCCFLSPIANTPFRNPRLVEHLFILVSDAMSGGIMQRMGFMDRIWSHYLAAFPQRSQEILNFLGFPRNFILPKDMDLKHRYKACGLKTWRHGDLSNVYMELESIATGCHRYWYSCI